MRKEIKTEDVVYAIKCLHYCTNLPIRYYNNDSLLFSIPEKIETANSILNLKNIPSNVIESDNKIQLIENILKEIYITIDYDGKHSIIIGPLLNEAIEPGNLTNMVRQHLIPFHQKTTMQEYYNNVLVLNKQKLHYTKILLEKLLTQTSLRDMRKEDEKEDEFMEKESHLNSYFMQKREYRQSSFIHSPYFIEQEICKTISNGDIENSKRILKEINLIPHARLASSTIRSYKNSMICSCSFMTRAAIAGGVNPDAAFTLSDAYINEIENMQTIDELENFEAKMVEGFSSQVREIKNQTYSPAVLNSIYYIDNHLCDDLSIKKIAKEVYLNPCYLSSLFHQETGLTISDWIKQKRIEESSKLVLNSNEDIADIAFFYRFCSQSYYVQCFKKIMGLTPGEYRKKTRLLKNSNYISI